MVQTPQALAALLALLVLGFTLDMTGPASAQVLAVGQELQVNENTADYQDTVSIGVDGEGGFVVVWETYQEATEDGDIKGRRYDSAGQAMTGEFLVSTFTTDSQLDPVVAMNASGRFVVTWNTDAPIPGTDSSSVQAQLFTSDGSLLGDPFVVNAYTTDGQRLSSVEMDASGSFVVAWQSFGSDGTDTNLYSIQARRFAADASPLDDQFQVNVYATGHQRLPDIALTPTGAFIVVWESRGSAGDDSSFDSVHARLYASDGSAISGELQVNTYTTDAQTDPVVASDAEGNFMVVWQSFGSDNGDNSGWSVQARRLAADGSFLGDQFLVPAYVTGSQQSPSIGSDGAGRFVISWQSDRALGDSSGQSVQARHFASDGSGLGEAFQVNSYTTANQSRPSVAVSQSGDFVIAWDSDGSAGTDTHETSVHAQVFRVTGGVGDRVWRDADSDGQQDEGEAGVAGVRVNLWDDLSELVAATETDDQGLFLLKAEPGNYFLEFELPADFLFTQMGPGGSPSDSDADPATGETPTFSLELGMDDLSLDAGLVRGPDFLFGDSFESGDTSAWVMTFP